MTLQRVLQLLKINYHFLFIKMNNLGKILLVIMIAVTGKLYSQTDTIIGDFLIEKNSQLSQTKFNQIGQNVDFIDFKKYQSAIIVKKTGVNSYTEVFLFSDSIIEYLKFSGKNEGSKFRYLEIDKVKNEPLKFEEGINFQVINTKLRLEGCDVILQFINSGEIVSSLYFSSTYEDIRLLKRMEWYDSLIESYFEVFNFVN